VRLCVRASISLTRKAKANNRLYRARYRTQKVPNTHTDTQKESELASERERADVMWRKNGFVCCVKNKNSLPAQSEISQRNTFFLLSTNKDTLTRMPGTERNTLATH
jgi:hypothetical protein